MHVNIKEMCNQSVMFRKKKSYLSFGTEGKLNFFSQQGLKWKTNICPISVVNLDSVCFKGKRVHNVRIMWRLYMAYAWNLFPLNHFKLKFSFKSVEGNCQLPSHAVAWLFNLLSPSFAHPLWSGFWRRPFLKYSISIKYNKKISLTVPQTRRQDRPQEATQASSESKVHQQGLGREGNCG